MILCASILSDKSLMQEALRLIWQLHRFTTFTNYWIGEIVFLIVAVRFFGDTSYPELATTPAVTVCIFVSQACTEIVLLLYRLCTEIVLPMYRSCIGRINMYRLPNSTSFVPKLTCTEIVHPLSRKCHVPIWTLPVITYFMLHAVKQNENDAYCITTS